MNNNFNNTLVVLKHLLVYLFLVFHVALWNVGSSYIKKKTPVCTLTVSHAQHCTVNNVQAGGGQHTKIKILFTSDKNKPSQHILAFSSVRYTEMWLKWKKEKPVKRPDAVFPSPNNLPTVSFGKLQGDNVDKYLYKFLILCIKDLILHHLSRTADRMLVQTTAQEDQWLSTLWFNHKCIQLGLWERDRCTIALKQRSGF